MTYKLSAVIEQDEHGCYAYCPELKGCHTQGDSVEEAMANLKEAIELYLETLSPDEIQAVTSRTILTTSLEVVAGA
jgi:predicted RNase H-like HicB family nuclease